MRVKRVTINGFKSYKQLELEEDLSPGLNLVLGSNGSGKSNFLEGKLADTDTEPSHHICAL